MTVSSGHDGELGVTVAWREGVLYVAGEVDAHTCSVVRRAIAEHIGAGIIELIIDLSGCTFCDAACAATLLEPITHRVAVTLRRPTPSVLRVLRVLEADQVLTIEL